MMSASSLPSAPAAMPAGFATFLANIGEVSTGGGETAGFEQLLAATPVNGAVPAAAKIDPATVAQTLPVDGALPQSEAAPIETAVTPEAPATKPVASEADAAAALAANLLIALNGSAPAAAPVPGKPVPAETATETDIATAGSAAEETATAAPVVVWLAAIAAAPTTDKSAADKPAKPVATAPAPAVDTAPTATAAPTAAKARDMAPPMPMLTVAEPLAAKSADAAPSMTILFTQPGPQGAALPGDAVRPAVVAERILDMGSDGAWIDQLARDIAATRSETGDISFRLTPRHLGRLDVAMQMGDEGVSLKMDTHHEATATIVTAAQGRLVEDLRQQGVRVAGAEVTCTPGETGRQSQGQGQGRGATHDPAHLIEIATERAESRRKTDSEERAGDRRSRFA